MDIGETLPRHAQQAVDLALTDTPVVVIQGARQVGKSTLASMVARGRSSVTLTLDDPPTLAVAQSDPEFLLTRAGDGLLVVDEAQRAPGLLLPLKANVDRDRRPGRFLLTGSADLLQVKGAGDSLAGRAETVELLPLSQGELSRRSAPEDFISWLLSDTGSGADSFSALAAEQVVIGGYPEAVRRAPARAARWLSAYVGRLADHDARELQQGGYAGHMRSLLELVAAGGQAELVRARLARALGVAENTAESYVQLATTMRLLVSVPPWGRSPRGRVSRRPKVCLNDTGLSAHLAGFTSAMAQNVGGREFYGALVEQFVALELVKQSAWSAEPYRLFHYRDHGGLEVDLLAELSDGRLVAIEVKSSRSVTSSSWSALEQFRDRHPDRQVVGVVLHGGRDVAHLRGWLHVLPVTALWQH